MDAEDVPFVCYQVRDENAKNNNKARDSGPIQSLLCLFFFLRFIVLVKTQWSKLTRYENFVCSTLFLISVWIK